MPWLFPKPIQLNLPDKPSPTIDVQQAEQRTQNYDNYFHTIHQTFNPSDYGMNKPDAGEHK